jgi:hypothetical protein
LPSEKAVQRDAFWRTIAKLEAKRKSKIFCLIHCHDDDGHICTPTLWQTLSHRDDFKNLDTLEVLLHTPGGVADIAYQVVRFFSPSLQAAKHHCSVASEERGHIDVLRR